MSARRYLSHDVPVNGGTLRVGQWESVAADSATPVVALHGVTANHLAWLCLADEYRYELIAPDLRGRGGSRNVAGPAGMDVHSTDIRAVLDYLDIDRAVIVGHSMGGFVASAFAAGQPDRVASVVLLDGGLPFPPPPSDMSEEDVIAATIGPAADRLSMTFADLSAYLDFWKQHPALAPHWSEAIEAYFEYDLVGQPPACRSSVSADLMDDDSRDLLNTSLVDQRVQALPDGSVFLRAEYGMMAEPGGLYSSDLIGQHVQVYPNVRIEDVPGVNHYTLVMTPAGAGRVAQVLRGSSA